MMTVSIPQQSTSRCSNHCFNLENDLKLPRNVPSPPPLTCLEDHWTFSSFGAPLCLYRQTYRHSAHVILICSKHHLPGNELVFQQLRKDDHGVVFVAACRFLYSAGDSSVGAAVLWEKKGPVDLELVHMPTPAFLRQSPIHGAERNQPKADKSALKRRIA